MYIFFQNEVNFNEIYGNAEFWGRWGAWSVECPLYSAVCGIEVKSQAPLLTGDTALNDVRLFCCDD